MAKKIPAIFLFFMVVFSTQLLYPEGVSEESPKSNVELTVMGLKGPTSIGMLHLIETQPTVSEFFDIKYQIINTPDLMVSRILSGEADMAALPINLAANLYNKGLPYNLGAVTGYGLFYIVSSHNEIKDIEDLRGKEIYSVGKGSTPEFVLRYLLNENGINPETDLMLDFKYSQVELAPLMISGKVETALLPEPFASIVAAKNKNLHIAVDLQAEWSRVQPVSNYPISAFVVKEEIFEKYREVIIDFLSLYNKSIEWTNANPAAVGELSEKYMDLPAEIISKSLSRLNLDFVHAAKAQHEVELFLEVLMDFRPEAIGGSLPDAEFYIR
jgi:NitT/TauT family transport system substrate-binding protein